MKKLVFSEKENRYVEAEFIVDIDGKKVYNESIQGYDKNGNSVFTLSDDEREQQFIATLETDIQNTPYAKQRLNICKNCEYYSYKFCKQCMCFMPFKVLIRGADCPVKKWNAIDE